MSLDIILYKSFSEELVKIAMAQPMTAARNALHAGWHGDPNIPGSDWRWGKQGIGRWVPGSKTMTVAGTALALPSTLKKEDPSGQGRSRLERGAGLAGGTFGGLMAAGATMKPIASLSKRRPVMGALASMAAGTAGMVAGEKAMTMPMAARRRARMLRAQAQTSREAMPPQPDLPPAHSPNAREGHTELV